METSDYHRALIGTGVIHLKQGNTEFKEEKQKMNFKNLLRADENTYVL